jgi:arylsulfatase A-like enzyme
MRPNVLLIVFDTARADAFEPYGAPAGSTPVAADLARRGRAVPMAISGANWTMPSHAAMFTGRLPRALGLSKPLVGRSLLNPRKILQANADRVLAEVLRRNGYATAGVSANPWISHGSAFSTGFERWADVRGEIPRSRSPRDRMEQYLRAVRGRADQGASDAVRLLRARLRERDPRPFFWFVNLMECHSPYLPPRPFTHRSVVGRLRAADDAMRYGNAVTMARYSMGNLEVPEAVLARLRDLYRRAVSMVDHTVGLLLEDLDAAGVLDDTAVILTADHGENLGEQHLLGHTRSIDQRLIHVPLIMAGPLDPPASDLFSQPDLPALLAEGLELEASPWAPACPPGTAVSQSDLSSLWNDEQVEHLARVWGVPREVIREAGPYAAILDGRFKLARTGDADVLFDLDADPGETRDVGDAHPQRAKELRELLDGVQADLGVEGRTGYTPREEAEMQDHLEALGYL